MVQKRSAAEAKRRGRPPAYDPQLALKKATDAFWRSGYSATSLDDITTATGMNKPSLYAVFGDKHALYLASLESYLRDALAEMRLALSEDTPLDQALMQVYDSALATYFSGPGRARGCFMLGTAVTEAVDDLEIRKALLDRFREFDRVFEARFKAAQDHGALKKGSDPAILATLASATLHTIALRARAGESRSSLRELARSSVKVLCG